MNIFREMIDFIQQLVAKRLIIFQLARQDFHNRTIGSALGFVWTFAQPLVLTVIFWLVFGVAFKQGNVAGVPFIAWVIVGMAAWHFFSESLSLSTHVFQEYAFLVKKVNFKISVLPLVKILSSLAVHAVFLVIVIVVLLVCRVPFSWYWFQVFYYLAALFFLLLGLSWLASSLTIFVKDLGHVISILLQFGFWFTAVVVPPSRISMKWLPILQLNPVFYIVDGYRRSFIYHIPFWQDWGLTLYFWTFTLAILVLGVFTFKKLKPHFADIL